MFLILNSKNLIVDISEYAHYARRQKNNIVVSCDKTKSDAIYSANTDKFYPIESVGYSENHALIEVDEIPPEVTAGYYFYRDSKFYITEEKQAELERIRASDDMLEIVVGQEYRLMLLELGV